MTTTPRRDPTACTRDCGTCEDCCSTDTWVVPSGLTSAETGRPATETHEQTEDAPAPALTVHGSTAALRALGRDGGER